MERLRKYLLNLFSKIFPLGNFGNNIASCTCDWIEYRHILGFNFRIKLHLGIFQSISIFVMILEHAYILYTPGISRLIVVIHVMWVKQCHFYHP